MYAADSRLIAAKGSPIQPTLDSVKDKKYFGDGTGVGLRKDDAELTAAFNKALGELRQDGTYDKMAKKYFDFNVYGD